jgi:hypothetical protein
VTIRSGEPGSSGATITHSISGSSDDVEWCVSDLDRGGTDAIARAVSATRERDEAIQS